MIEINETFTVDAPVADVYAVLSSPHAVVECVQGAALSAQNDDGTYDGTLAVKFGALRVSFAGRVSVEFDDDQRQGTVVATGRDGQGGTKFRATASFQALPVGESACEVRAQGQVVLSGKLASMIEAAAGTVVRRMTSAFVEALSLRCASESATLAPAAAVPGPADQPVVESATVGPEATGDRAAASAAVLLLHGLGGSPAGLRPWGEGLAERGIAVSIPRLPGHGTRWQDLRRTTSNDWYAAAREELLRLRGEHDLVLVMGLGLGGVLALRLAEEYREDVAGVVVVNPMLSAPRGVPRPVWLTRFVRWSVKAMKGDIKKRDRVDPSYDRMPLAAVYSIEQFGQRVMNDLELIASPVVLVVSREDHVVAIGDAEAIWGGLPPSLRSRIDCENSYHLVPLDNDAPMLIDRSAEFVESVAARPLSA